MNPEIVPRLRKAEEMHVCVTNSLTQKHTATERSELFARFLSIMISHHESILTLLRIQPLAGSALALFRPLVETGFRGHFAAFLATDEQIQRIKSGTLKYPFFNDMATSLDETFGTSGLFSKYKGDTWKALCGFAHSGLEQLGRRVKPDGTLGAEYETELIIQLINSSTSVLVLTSIPYLQLATLEEAAKNVSDRYISLYEK